MALASRNSKFRLRIPKCFFGIRSIVLIFGAIWPSVWLNLPDLDGSCELQSVMSVLASFFSVCIGTGALYRVQWLVIKQLLVLCHVLYITHANLPELLEADVGSPTTAPLAVPAIPELPLPANLPLTHVPPSFVEAINEEEQLSGSQFWPCASSFGRYCPITAHNAGTIPAGLAQPPLSPYTSTPLSATSPAEASPRLPSSATSIVTSNKGKNPNLILIVGIGAGVLIIGIFAVLIICSRSSHQGKTKASIKETAKDCGCGYSSTQSLRHPTSTRFLAYEELKEATNNFEAASILGEGGFGRVFKGVLSDGTAVAIKRLTSGGQQGDKEFLVEVEMLSRLHHRNLVKLVGYYSNRDSSQNLLCYELVPNGSLEAWLHGPLGVNCPLDWDTRMKIALDAARGLAYLHEDSQPCVIHRDFKASNILLENNFNAKVADFGLAKQAPEGRANYLSTRVMGTFGYVAPEYAMTGHLLVKSDVYSYGVVLLELLTGRKPVDMSQPSGQENLVTWARPILRDKDRLEELADPRLGGKYPKEDFVRVCTIAAACVAPEASQRPTMGEVVQSLKMVQHITENQDSMLTSSNTRPNLRQSSTTFESDGTSSIFSSGPYSGLSALDNDNVSQNAVFSEDLHEGR
ncbi:protein kinase superfamily protein [Actinidia rufa]|uniref:Protein kinase superfamily protein n=1 Tax=Actinidia rufa TaxID=165716 RepID=A0A7J0H8E5_9ERIC|nr:protein kinase superfamily protein [Actinidia rufa]